MKIMVWNVNGLRACLGKGFLEWFDAVRPSVLGLQETRALPEQIDDGLLPPPGYRIYWNPAERRGYSGTALLTRRKPISLETTLGSEEFDREGRLQIAEFSDWVFFNAYFPNGKGKERDNSRVPYKLAFYEALLQRARSWLRRGKGVVLGGDFNTAHREIDLKNWKSNRKTSGFLPEERAMIDRYLEAGFVDVLRERNPTEEGLYTWWSQRQGARERNVGWRIDYLLPSRDLLERVRRAWLEPQVLGSDHCPLGIDLVRPR